MGLKPSSLLDEFVAGQAAILDALPAHVALLDADGRIVAVNEAWRRFARDNQFADPAFGVGANYIEVCSRAEGDSCDEAHLVALKLRALLDRTAGAFRIEYPCHSLDEERWFLIMATPIVFPHGDGAMVMHFNISERRTAERESKRLAARVTTTLETISDAFYLLDREWRFSFLNAEAERLLRRNRAALLGRVIWDVFKGSAETALYPQYSRAAAQQVPAAFVFFYAPLRAWLDVRAYPSDEGLAVYFRDVTEQHLAEELLRANEARFRAIARATADVIWDWNLVAKTIWWSDSVQRMFGYEPSEIEAQPQIWNERVHPDDRERVVAGIRAVIERREEHWEDEYRIVHRNGSHIEVSARGFLVFDERGEAVRMVGGMSDISERKEAQARLAEQAALLNEAPDAIIVRDMDQRIRFWNRSAERIYGWTIAEALGRPIEELLYSRDATAFWRAMATLHERGEWRGRISQMRKDGSTLVVEGNWSLVKDERGEPCSILAINTDMTQRIALEEQLRQAQRLEAIGQLTGGVAHDFNNLLQVIMGNAEALGEALDGQPKLRTLAEMTKVAAERGAELTNRLLAFARRQALEPQSTDIAVTLDAMNGLLRRTLGQSIEIEVICQRGLWQALVDAAQLESALLNLCINARDAMPSGGRLTIEAANNYLDEDYAQVETEVTPGQYVLLAVTDTGTGMAPDVVARSIEPFFTTKSIGKGSGLGLSMVFGFVKQSGGHMKLYSEPDEGTTVKLYLPRFYGERRQAPAPAVPQVSLGQNEKILVVEDDDLVREHVTSQLRSIGYRVVAVGNGADALEALENFADFNLLFTDVVIPGGISGRDLAALAVALRPGLGVLFSSGYTENAMFHQGRLDSAAIVLNKPYRRGELSSKVRSALDARTLSREGMR